MARPIVRFIKTGQPMVRTPSGGVRFGFKREAQGPFEDAGNMIVAGAADAIAAAAIEIMLASLEQCPIDTGTLRRSARYELAQEATGNIQVRMGYGYGDEINPETRRPASDYAIPVHEILEARHNPPTKAKFLEDPLLEHASTIAPYMAATIKAKLLGTGKGAPTMIRNASGAEFSFESIGGAVMGIHDIPNA